MTDDASRRDDPLPRAAELRARGREWDEIATALGIPERDLRAVAQADSDRWRGLVRAAARERTRLLGLRAAEHLERLMKLEPNAERTRELQRRMRQPMKPRS